MKKKTTEQALRILGVVVGEASKKVAEDDEANKQQEERQKRREERTRFYVVNCLEAIEEGRVDLLKALIEKHTDFFTIFKRYGGTIFGDTPLLQAAHRGHVDVIELLINKAGGKFDDKNKRGQNALMVAVIAKRSEAVKFFLEKYKSLAEETDKDGCTALLIASQTGNIVIFDLLANCVDQDRLKKKNSYGSDALRLAILAGQLELVKHILENYPFSITEHDDEGRTALHFTATRGNKEILDYLITKTELAFSLVDYNGNNILLTALENDRYELAEHMLKTYDKNQLSFVNKNTGRTPLHSAAELGLLDICKSLVFLLNISSMLKDNRGYTPLLLAIEAGEIPIVQFFLEEFDCDLSCALPNNETALSIAEKTGNNELVSLITKHQIAQSRMQYSFKTVLNDFETVCTQNKSLLDENTQFKKLLLEATCREENLQKEYHQNVQLIKQKDIEIEKLKAEKQLLTKSNSALTAERDDLKSQVVKLIEVKTKLEEDIKQLTENYSQYFTKLSFSSKPSSPGASKNNHGSSNSPNHRK